MLTGTVATRAGQDLLDRADDLINQGKFRDAGLLYRQAANQTADGATLLGAVTGLLHIAYYHDRYEEADSLIAVGEDLLRREPGLDSSLRLHFLQKKAETLRGRSDYREALDLHLQVLNGLRRLDEPYITAYAYLYLSASLEKLFEHDRALVYGDSALARFEDILEPGDPRWASIYNIQAVNYQRISDFRQAEVFYRKSIGVLEATQGDSSARLSAVYNNLAGVYSSEGKYLRAIELIRQSEGINRKRGDRIGLGSNFYSLAVNYYYLGDWGRSREYLEACIRIREELLGPDHYRLAAPNEVLGIVYEALRDFDQNIRYLKKALAIKRAIFGDDNLDIGFSYENIALGYLQSGQLDSARRYIELAHGILSHHLKDNSLELAGHLHSRASVLLELGLARQALGIADESEEIFRELGLSGSPDYALAQTLRGKVYEQLGQDDEARQAFRTALTGLQRSGLQRGGLPVSLTSLDLLHNYIAFLYHLYRKEGDEAVLDSIGRYVSQAQQVADDFKRQTTDPYTKVAVAANTAGLYRQNTAIYHDLYRQGGGKEWAEALFHLAERNRATLFRHLIDDYKLERYAGIAKEDLRLEDSLRQLIAGLNSSMIATGGTDSLRNALFLAREAQYDLIARFTTRYPAYFTLKYEDRELPLQEVRDRLLPGGKTLVEFMEDDTAYYALVLTGQDIEVEYLAARTRIDGLVDSWRRAVNRLDAAATERTGNALYELLWIPLESAVTTSVVIIPAGSLHYLNFEALPLPGEEGKYLIETHRFAYGLSATVLLHQLESQPKPRRRSIIVAPGFGDELKESYRTNLPAGEAPDEHFLSTVRQPWSVRMARKLSRRGSIRPLIGEAATETEVKSRLSGGSIVHFATHALADESDPLRSRLVLAKDIGPQVNDGYLHAYELYGIPVQAELAILSACESGIGNLQDGEGMISLAYSMNYAGCPSVIMSLWEIDERTNSRLLEGFYAYLGKGLPKSEALRRAKLDFLQKADGAERHPFYWSGLVVLGSDAPVHPGPGNWRWSLLLLLPVLAGLAWWLKRKKTSLRSAG